MEALEQRLVPAIMVMGAVGNEADGTLTFNLVGNGLNPLPLNLNYYTVDGTATSVSPGDGFTAVSGTLTLAPFDVFSHPVVVMINNDTFSEGSIDEQFTLVVGGDETGIGYGFIQDDDAAFTENIIMAADDSYEMFNDQVLIVAPSDVDWIGANDSGMPRSYSLDLASLPSSSVAIISLSSDGTMTVDADDDFDGEIEFSYFLTDGIVTVSANVKVGKWAVTIQNKWTASGALSTVSGKNLLGHERVTEVYIGEELNIEAKFKKGLDTTPPNRDMQWNIPGSHMRDYSESNALGDSVDVPLTVYYSDAMNFFWVAPGMRLVTYSYIFVDDPRMASHSVTAKFDVKGPNIDALATANPSLQGVLLLPTPRGAMRFGRSVDASGSSGMFFEMPVAPAGYSLADFSLRQIVDSTMNRKGTDDGREWIATATGVLDGNLAALHWDSPSRGFNGATWYHTRDDFTTWAMWQSPNVARRTHKVGVASVSWFWEGGVIRTSDNTVAVANATYDFVRDAGEPTYRYSETQFFTTHYALPEWTGNITDIMPPPVGGVSDFNWIEFL